MEATECGLRIHVRKRNLLSRIRRGSQKRRRRLRNLRRSKPCQAAVDLPTLARSLDPQRSSHADLIRANVERPPPPRAPPRPALAQRTVGVPAWVHQEPGDGRIDNPVEQGADREDA